jgi:hypothetical protein
MSPLPSVSMRAIKASAIFTPGVSSISTDTPSAPMVR